jgi:hypothetical protein
MVTLFITSVLNSENSFGEKNNGNILYFVVRGVRMESETSYGL